MGSGGKRKTTMAKLAREHRLRERRLDKQARKEARKNAPPDQAGDTEGLLEAVPLPALLDDGGGAPAPLAGDAVEPSE